MKIEEFVTKREYLYHLTDNGNLEKIISRKELLSAEAILGLSELDKNHQNAFLSERRKKHEVIKIGADSYHIRDQRPISILNLLKCLTRGFTKEDFFRMLNDRVFFWPTLKRLNSHFKRYSKENPVILRVRTVDILKINPHAEFCRLNSGATRSNSYLKGAPPERGNGTFLPADQFKFTVSNVAEVTFPGKCNLPTNISIGYSPDGPWKDILI